MKVLHLDKNHDILSSKLLKAGFENYFDYESPKDVIENSIHNYDGLIVRSRFPIDEQFLKKATSLKFIGRVGAGLENIDVQTAYRLSISCYNAPEGNRNAVGEHALGMLLSLFNKLNTADQEVKRGIWNREKNRGTEIEGKTVGLIGYGNMGKSFARKLSGFDCRVIFYDLKKNIGNEYADQVTLSELKEQSDILSLHTPQTPLTIKMVDKNFIDGFKKPFYLINTARGKSVAIKDLVEAMQTGKILGAGLDVLEYEKGSFESLFQNTQENNGKMMPEEFKTLISLENVILSPHVAGWTVESKQKLAEVIADKIIKNHNSQT